MTSHFMHFAKSLASNVGLSNYLKSQFGYFLSLLGLLLGFEPTRCFGLGLHVVNYKQTRASLHKVVHLMQGVNNKLR